MTDKKRKVIGGLQPTPHDPRDFSFAGVFGYVDVREIPLVDFMVATPISIKDQGGTDMCTAFALCSVSEDQEGVVLDPAWVFSRIKRMQGSWKTWGGDLRSGCKVAQNEGFVEEKDSPFGLESKTRNFLANWFNWPDLLAIAAKHRKESYVKIDGPYDTFDNIRTALWTHKADHKSVYTGCVWRNGWLYTPGGVIPKRIISGGVGHAFKVCGQKMINGEPHLIIQNSFGNDVGDGGFHYFPRSVVNREFTFGAYQFTDMAPEEVKAILRGKGLIVGKKLTPFERVWRVIKRLFNDWK